jgi:MFS transporter, putative metabolite:H+ symporter
MAAMTSARVNKVAFLVVLVAALGYFVDIYDLILFSVVRVPSLREMGLSGQALTDRGLLLLNLQMTGMLLGGITFGVLGDKLGRLSVLFGSILLYSLANLANAFVHDVNSYALLRLVAGFGLAGELGAGITLVAESLPAEKRGLGTTIVGAVGVSGALLAWFVASHFQWRAAYIVGGGMGITLLLLRVGVMESGLFQSLREKEIPRGDLLLFFRSGERVRRFLGAVMVGLPIWYIVGILVTLSPEFAKVLGVVGDVDGGRAVFASYSGLVIGDICSGLLSQALRSRKKSIGFFLSLTAAGVAGYFIFRGLSSQHFYWLCSYLGFATGYWAMFATVAAEQFGTNLRATVATSAPNFVRGALVPISALFVALKAVIGILPAGMTVGALVMSLAFIGLAMLQESYSTSLDFDER